MTPCDERLSLLERQLTLLLERVGAREERRWKIRNYGKAGRARLDTGDHRVVDFGVAAAEANSCSWCTCSSIRNDPTFDSIRSIS